MVGFFVTLTLVLGMLSGFLFGLTAMASHMKETGCAKYAVMEGAR